MNTVRFYTVAEYNAQVGELLVEGWNLPDAMEEVGMREHADRAAYDLWALEQDALACAWEQ